MKLCLFSDLHGNSRAAESAFKQMTDGNADLYICLGDICGYYFEVIYVWDLLQKLPNLVYVLGNHDKIFLDSINNGFVDTEYTKKYGPSLEILYNQVTSPKGRMFVEWLQACPRFIKNDIFFAVHGSPNDFLNGYVYPDSCLPSGVLPPLVFMGHTHYSMVRQQGGTLFINPGSLGQPRDRKPPSFMTVVLPKNEFYTHYVQYDVGAFVKDLASMKNIPPYLINILKRSL